ncbi:MAG TPA: hypothetical protein DCE39_20760 [Planctomycetaceae bacterium]|nr:hypothetical protein [Planctomycetaceae bacterium]|tara:strand:- start:4524 stop:5366 length:843 start_codon:yes stop_codon:yes gene_type:complete
MSGSQIEFRTGRVSSREVFSEARTLMSGHFWIMVGICFLGILIGGVAPMGVLMGPMMCGIFMCWFAIMRNEKPTFSLLFEGFDVFMESLVAMLIQLGISMLTMILSFVVMAVGGAALVAVAGAGGGQPGGNAGAAMGLLTIGIFLFYGLIIGVSILVGTLFAFTWPLIVDYRLSGLEAVKLSARAAWANLGNVFRLMILNAVVAGVAAVFCYLPLFLVLPIVFGSQAVLYRRIFPAVVSPGPVGEYWEEPQPDLGGGGYQLDGGVADQGSADWAKDDNWE